MPDLSTMKDQAVDLNKALDDREKERERARQVEEAAIEAAARQWTKAMRRTFKGIFPHSSRVAFMRAAERRGDLDA